MDEEQPVVEELLTEEQQIERLLNGQAPVPQDWIKPHPLDGAL